MRLIRSPLSGAVDHSRGTFMTVWNISPSLMLSFIML